MADNKNAADKAPTSDDSNAKLIALSKRYEQLEGDNAVLLKQLDEQTAKLAAVSGDKLAKQVAVLEAQNKDLAAKLDAALKARGTSGKGTAASVGRPWRHPARTKKPLTAVAENSRK